MRTPSAIKPGKRRDSTKKENRLSLSEKKDNKTSGGGGSVILGDKFEDSHSNLAPRNDFLPPPPVRDYPWDLPPPNTHVSFFKKKGGGCTLIYGIKLSYYFPLIYG